VAVTPGTASPRASGQPALLLGIASPRRDWEQSLEELAALARSAGARIVGCVTQRRDKPDPAMFLGRGKAEEARDLITQHQAEIAIADADLTPVQQRNLEHIVRVPTIDRTGLILDIFAQRARSNEGKLQVQYAQLLYMLPRLAGRGIFLSRLGGGIGTRGPGETKLEADRRRIRHRLQILKKQMQEISRHRSLQRSARKASNLPLASLVGYTNAGKSSLLNALCSTDAFISDRLFATLDPTVRRLALPAGTTILLSDTVGFIRNLPPQLMTAFRATLEEVAEADILIHVLDASRPDVIECAEAVSRVLAELGAADRPMLTALNKADLVSDRALPRKLAERFSPAVPVSALKGTGLPRLKRAIEQLAQGQFERVTVRLPADRQDLVSLARRHGRVVSVDYLEVKPDAHALPADGSRPRIRLTARVPPAIAAQLRQAARSL
jgi:GTP-binding protein HflX